MRLRLLPVGAGGTKAPLRRPYILLNALFRLLALRSWLPAAERTDYFPISDFHLRQFHLLILQPFCPILWQILLLNTADGLGLGIGKIWHLFIVAVKPKNY
jgi:hypothetical protein